MNISYSGTLFPIHPAIWSSNILDSHKGAHLQDQVSVTVGRMQAKMVGQLGNRDLSALLSSTNGREKLSD